MMAEIAPDYLSSRYRSVVSSTEVRVFLKALLSSLVYRAFALRRRVFRLSDGSRKNETLQCTTEKGTR